MKLPVLNKKYLYFICSNIILYLAILGIFNVESKWATWFLLGLLALFLAPIASRIFGNIENFLFCSLVFSLQLQVGFNPIYRQMNKMAGLNGINISLCLIIALLLFSTWFIKRCVQVTRPLATNTIWNVAWASFLLTSAISIVKTSDMHLTVFGIFEIISLILIATITCHYCSTRKGLHTARTVLLVGLLTQSLVIIVQNITGLEFTLAGQSVVRQGSRFSGTMIVPSAAATYIMVLLFFTIGTAFSTVSRQKKAFLWFITSLGILSLLLTLTRSAWIGFFIGIIILLAYYYMKKAIRLSSIAYIAIILILGVILAWPVLEKRLYEEDHYEDSIVRLNLILIAFHMIEKNPLLGVGLNNATQVVNKYAAETPLIRNADGFVWVFIVHNQFLLIASETGIPGLIAFLSVIGIALRAAVLGMCGRDPVLSETGAILLASIVALIWSLNMDHVSGAQTYILLWFIMSFAMGVRNIVRAETAAKGSTPYGWHAFHPLYEAQNGATQRGSTGLVDAYADATGRFGAPR